MADDPNKRGRQDRERINIHEDYELRDWSKHFHVSPDELKRAVAKVPLGLEADETKQSG